MTTSTASSKPAWTSSTPSCAKRHLQPAAAARMKTVNGHQSIAAALCTLLLATGASAPSPSEAQVVTKVLEFEPETLTIPAGTKVTWKVSDRIAHTVTTGTFTLGGNGLRTSQNPDGRIDLPLTKAREV